MIRRILTFIRFSHTVFALPFAFGAMLVAAHGMPSPRLCGLILLAMVFARTAAMTFNRLADWEIDKRNPRTAGRHLLVPRSAAIVLLLFNAAAFVATAWFINFICFALSPVALVIVFFYSLTKRFTSFSHFFLGLALGISPVGAWLAVRGRLDLPPLVLALAVLLWVAGFDLIYALQDYRFDKEEGLRSLVVRLGPERSLGWALRLHAAMFLLLVLFGLSAGLSWIFFSSLLLVLCGLIHEHMHSRRMDAEAINRAFFQSNAFVGLVFAAGIFLDLHWR